MIERQVFQLKRGNDYLLIPVVTDDFLVAGSSQAIIDEFKSFLKTKYTVRDLGPAEHYIGWKIDLDRQAGLTKISQAALAAQILEDFGMQECNASPTPYISGLNMEPLQHNEHPLDTNKYHLSSGVGALRYLADCTRPDLAFVVGNLARNLSKPSMRHWQAFKHILRYLRGTINDGIVYRRCPSVLTAQADADFANCKAIRQSTRGHILFFNGSPVAWQSKRIKTICTSTCEADYIAAGHATKSIRYARELLKAFGSKQIVPTPLAMDNQAAIKLAKANAPMRQSKYIDIHHHFIQEQVRTGSIVPTYHPSATLTADLLTKPLTQTRFSALKEGLKLKAGTAS